MKTSEEYQAFWETIRKYLETSFQNGEVTLADLANFLQGAHPASSQNKHQIISIIADYLKGGDPEISRLTRLAICLTVFSACNIGPNCTEIENLRLISLDLSYYNLTDLALAKFQALFSAIENSQLTSLDLRFSGVCDLAPDKFRAICEVIKNPQLTSISMYGNDISALRQSKFKALCDAIKNSQLTTLKIDLYKLSMQKKPTEFIALLKVIENSKLTELNHGCFLFGSLSPAILQALFGVIKNSQLTEIYISEYNFSALAPVEFQALCEAIKNSKATLLTLSEKNISGLTTEQFKTLSEAIEKSNLTSLDLGDFDLSELGPDKFQTLCTVIKNSSLTSLALCCQELDGDCFRDFWKTIEKSKLSSLKFTCFRSYSMYFLRRKSELEVLYEAIKNSQLISLSWGFSESKQHDRIFNGLSRAIINNSTLLEVKDLSKDEANAIAPALARNRKCADLCSKLKMTDLQISNDKEKSKGKEKETEENSLEVTEDEIINAINQAVEALEDWDVANNPSNLAVSLRLQNALFECFDTLFTKHHLILDASLFSYLPPDDTRTKELRVRYFVHSFITARNDEMEVANSFLNALPHCLDKRDQFVVFDKDDQKSFDMFLQKAAGYDSTIPLEDNNRIYLLQFVILKALETELSDKVNPNKTNNNSSFTQSKLGGLYDRIKTLPSISKKEALNDDLKNKITEFWSHMQKTLTEVPLKNTEKNNQLMQLIKSCETSLKKPIPGPIIKAPR